MLKRVAIVILFIAPLIATADTAKGISDCSNIGNTININGCAAGIAAREDARMQDELSRLATVLKRVEKFFAREVPTPNFVVPLQSAQDAWLKYRNEQCRFVVALAMGGSVSELDRQGCLAFLNEERANRLQEFRKQYEAEGY
jgi:uncharacterized protein YecT (DUF1311 family)